MRWSREHELSIVVPVYRGADTLDALVAELAPLTRPFATPNGRTARVTEVLLVHDCGPDDSPRGDGGVRDPGRGDPDDRRHHPVRAVRQRRLFRDRSSSD